MAYVKKLRFIMNRGPYCYPNTMTKIFDFLYLGGEDDARDKNQLQLNGITHVINCAEFYCQTGPAFYRDAIQKYIGFEAEDDDDYDILQHFDDVHKVIEDARLSGGKALIHCLMGVNRSGALAVAYAMVYKQWGPITAAKYVKNARKMLLTNEEFQSQLVQFARSKDLLHLEKLDSV